MSIAASIFKTTWEHYSGFFILVCCITILVFLYLNRSFVYEGYVKNSTDLIKDVKKSIYNPISKINNYVYNVSDGYIPLVPNIPTAVSPDKELLSVPIKVSDVDTKMSDTKVSDTKVSDTTLSESSDSKGEQECRRVLEFIFNRPFIKSRPLFLKNEVTSTNNHETYLEIDCFCPELRLGVEYHGIQHYKFVQIFHKSKDAFINQKYRDYIKRLLCFMNNVTLLEVPYTVPLDNIESYIIMNLERLGIISQK